MDLEQSGNKSLSLNNPDLDNLIEETKVQRWSNWVKFMSLFTMVESISTLIGNTLMEFIPTSDKDGRPLLVIYFINFISFIVGYFGYITSISKSSKITLNYLVALILSLTLQIILTLSYANEMANAVCDKKENKDKDCDENDYTILFYVILFIFVLCCFPPIMYCPYRLYKTAKELENKMMVQQDLELNDSGLFRDFHLPNSIRSFK